MERELVRFLIRAKQRTYASGDSPTFSSRPESHDFRYEEGSLSYLDTYLGGKRFAGEEGIWQDGKPVWAMNYAGRIIGEPFSGDVLKAALRAVPEDAPFRGPACFELGAYTYRCNFEGTEDWFFGQEEIQYQDKKVYECLFHGGTIE
jgi:hypothetical protein